jgi:hypothetical protein
MAKADEIADKLLDCLPSRLIVPEYLTHMERCALAAAAGCEMKLRMLEHGLDVATVHDILIRKDGDYFLVYERRLGEEGRLRGRVKGTLKATLQ